MRATLLVKIRQARAGASCPLSRFLLPFLDSKCLSRRLMERQMRAVDSESLTKAPSMKKALRGATRRRIPSPPSLLHPHGGGLAAAPGR